MPKIYWGESLHLALALLGKTMALVFGVCGTLISPYGSVCFCQGYVTEPQRTFVTHPLGADLRGNPQINKTPGCTPRCASTL